MQEKIYGRNKPSYGIVERADGRIELRVYHRNKNACRLLRQHQADPRYFLGRLDAFDRSNTRAHYWLAQVIKDYRGHFAANRVLIRFAGEPEPAARAQTRPQPKPTPAPSKIEPRPKTIAEPAAGRTIALVACVSRKRTVPRPAGELYTSDWFVKASRYAQQAGDQWYILSARYGLVSPETVIAPYDVTLNQLSAGQRRRWAARVVEELAEIVRAGDRVLILAGQRYRENLIGPLRGLGARVEVPMEGLRIGEQLRWLNQRLGSGAPKPRLVERPARGRSRLEDVQRFYELMDQLEERLGGKRRLGDCSGRMPWPERGVYFFFEAGEQRSSSGAGPRVVRVGTHGLTAGSKSTLWQRLRQHRGTQKGGGNHRGSIFRLHVGTALIKRHPVSPSVSRQWGVGSHASREVREREAPLEQMVSEALQAMTLLWLAVEDPPGKDSMRGVVERNAIALLSNYHHPGTPIDLPSQNWLGRLADREQVRRSGLWNVNHVEEAHDPAFLALLEGLIANM